MIVLNLLGCQWGTDPFVDKTPDGDVQGMRLNLQDPNSGMLIHVPFTGEALHQLAVAAINQLTEEQKRSLMPVISGGIHLPDGVQRGPQG